MENVLIKSDYEIENGKPMPSVNHAIVQANIIILIGRLYFEQYRVVSELSINITGEKLVPDVAIYDEIPFVAGKDQITASKPPLCAIEILSPTQSLTELITKSEAYFKGGVKSYWLVIPDLRTVYIFYAPTDFSVFIKSEKLMDSQMNINLNLDDIFK